MNLNLEKALDILDFKDTNILEISESELKQRYRMFALMYHPDKNNAEDASIRFLEIKEAYDLLQKNMSNVNMVDNDFEYNRILKEYLGIQIVDNKVNEILDNILSVCEKQAISILEKIDEKKFKMMFILLKKYRHVFFLSETFYQLMEEINERKLKKKEEREIIELYPTINDLFQHMVYKLYKNTELYLVPLWHSELIYEDKKIGKDFIVRCIPNLVLTKPLETEIVDFSIDENNNFHCTIHYKIAYILKKSINKEKITVNFGDYKSVCFNPWELNIVEKQTIRWKKEGISIPNTDIYDISNKADILLHIFLLS